MHGRHLVHAAAKRRGGGYHTGYHHHPTTYLPYAVSASTKNSTFAVVVVVVVAFAFAFASVVATAAFAAATTLACRFRTTSAAQYSNPSGNWRAIWWASGRYQWIDR